jgi:hypothetical protein
MPDPVHDHSNPGRIPQAEGLHAYDGDFEAIHYNNDENVSKKETGDRNEEVRKKSRRPVVNPSSMNGRTDPDGEGKSPCENGPDNEKGKTVQKSFPDLGQYRLVVFPGHRSARKKISVVVEILDVERFVEVEGLAETFHDLRSETGVERVYLARFAGREIHNEKRDDGNEEESDDLLDDASADKRKHKKCLKFENHKNTEDSRQNTE